MSRIMDEQRSLCYPHIVKENCCQNGGRDMRILAKILLFSVTLALSIIVAVLRLLCLISGTVLGVLALVILLIAVGTVVLLGEPILTGLGIAGLAWLISPFGLPLVATFLVEAIGGFNTMLKGI